MLAFSVFENKGVYALLLGSGLSRAAEIPTGWEITLDLVRRLGRLEGAEEQTDWAAWYRQATGREPKYSELLDRLSTTPDERRAILHSYIEPTPEDIEEGRKTPTKAHRAIAQLVRDKFVRVIITTNFDRLLENALRDEGVEPTVISSVDALAGAVPLTHSNCYVIKLHGDYLDTRIRNTEEELGDYPDEFKAMLARIFDEHGLIIGGWSGDWDHALRSTILRAPNRRYPMFWAARGTPSTVAQDIISQRAGKTIAISDADSFFARLTEQLRIQEEIGRPNPQSVELLIAATKKYLVKSEYRIQLNDLVGHEVRRAFDQLHAPDLRIQGATWSPDEFQRRVARYEAIAEPLVRVLGILGRWGDESEFALAFEAICGLYEPAEHNGLTAFLDLQGYPVLLAAYGYGLGALRAGRHKAVFDLFSAAIPERYNDGKQIATSYFLDAWSCAKHWKILDGPSQRKTPLSDHLFSLTSSWWIDYDSLPNLHCHYFNMFELLGSLAFMSINNSTKNLKSALQKPSPTIYVPVGRLSWQIHEKERYFSQIIERDFAKLLIEAGFSRGDVEHFEAAVGNIQRVMAARE